SQILSSPSLSLSKRSPAFGLPLEQNVNLVAQVTRPDGVISMLPLSHRGNGRYEAVLEDNKLMGAHNIVVRTIGTTPGNWPLQREQSLNGIVIRSTVDSDTDGKIQDITALLKAEKDTLDDLTNVVKNIIAKNRFSVQLAYWLPWALLLLI